MPTTTPALPVLTLRTGVPRASPALRSGRSSLVACSVFNAAWAFLIRFNASTALAKGAEAGPGAQTG